MVVIKEREISPEVRAATVDLLLKSHADLNTQENVRLYNKHNMKR